MCGIAGLLTPDPRIELALVLRSMAGAISHRGPDDEGFFEATTRDQHFRVGLAHRRLSIIDLSTGHQPIGNETGSVQIVFNGEIYNFEPLRTELIALGHVFSTRSDTETIVHAYEEWGPGCVERFRGMFAFALWDGDRQLLMIARDRFGKKPLFVHTRDDGSLAFGSEIKALLAVPGLRAEVDDSAIRDYLAFRYVPGPGTLYKGIRKLSPGSFAIWERGVLREQRYYLPPDREPHDRSGSLPVDVVGAFTEVLEEAVRIRMIADVPFGAFLSGGIDSSAVVALMTRYSEQPVRTFSVGFSESTYSELGYARTIAQYFHTEHHELEISESHLMDHLPAMIRHRDGPVAEPSDIPIFLLSKAASETVKMVLTGEGSDEFLGGYPKHRVERFAPVVGHVPPWLRENVLIPGVTAMPYRFRRLKTATSALLLSDRRERMARWFGAMSFKDADALLAPGFAERTALRDPLPFDALDGNSALRAILYFDQMSWLPDNLLERGDRMTMAASIEARMPFMDHDLAAFVSKLPDKWRIRGGVSKFVLRQAMKRILPAEILERPKVGFRVPVNEWFRGKMRGYLSENLLGSDSRTRDYYRAGSVKTLVEEHVSGRQNHEKVLWTSRTS